VFHPTSAGSFSSYYTSTPSVLTALIISGFNIKVSRLFPKDKSIFSDKEKNESGAAMMKVTPTDVMMKQGSDAAPLMKRGS
jgi:hypothetical protein